MKKTILSLLCVVTTLCSAWAQQEPVCGFDRNSAPVRSAEANKVIMAEAARIASNKLYETTSSHFKTIPVVVHVIHNGGTENISNTQIQSQVDVLNEDFGKIALSPGDGNGVDTEVRFCLAKITPDGKCTDGIVRVKSTLTTHQTYQRSQLAGLSVWDATRYLNIYIVKNISGGSTLGYASFPGGPVNEDGVVIAYNYFGRTGTIAGGTSGRTASHEVGHWLGLYHTFNGGCGVDTCADGDYVCDTPPAANPNFGCPVINSCANDVPNVSDQIQNYMDYSNDGCKSMFTDGQKTRVQATLNTLRNVIWQAANITSTGCDSAYVSPPCNAVADFTSNGQNICVGNPVQFVNRSLNNPITYLWYFPGGTPSTSTAQNPTVVYSALGSYNVSLVATNSNGTDSVTFTNYITVSNPVPGLALPYSEGFETSAFPPNGIVLDNPDAGITWERDTIAVQYAGLGSAKINNLINTNYGQADAMILPTFDLTTFTNPYISFRWAYAKSDPNYSDELIVLISTDCGVNFTQIFYRTGSTMTTGATQTTPYIPDSNTVWKLANVSLGSYATCDHAVLKIVNVTDGGNNLYIDNINLGASAVGISENMPGANAVVVYPNPASEQVTVSVDHNVLSKGAELYLYDLMGNIIYREKMRTPQQVIDLRNYPAGIYFIAIRTASSLITKKVIKQK